MKCAGGSRERPAASSPRAAKHLSRHVPSSTIVYQHTAVDAAIEHPHIEERRCVMAFIGNSSACRLSL